MGRFRRQENSRLARWREGQIGRTLNEARATIEVSLSILEVFPMPIEINQKLHGELLAKLELQDNEI